MISISILYVLPIQEIAMYYQKRKTKKRVSVLVVMLYQKNKGDRED